MNEPCEPSPTPRRRPRLWRTAPRTLSRVVLTVLLVAAAAAPTLACQPDQRQPQARPAPLKRGLNAAGQRRGKGRTVTRNFANDTASAIPAAGAADKFGPAALYPSSLQVSGLKNGRITDLDLTLRGFSHTDPQDVDVLLVAPDGRNAVVLGDVGSAFGVTNVTITLDDEAAAPLPVDPATLTSEHFRPRDHMGLSDTDGPDLLTFPAPAPAASGKSALSTFDGSSPNGQWQLFIIDDSKLDSGALAGGWTLTITAKVKKHKGQHEHQRRH